MVTTQPKSHYASKKSNNANKKVTTQIKQSHNANKKVTTQVKKMSQRK